jgi:hypothetical protein
MSRKHNILYEMKKVTQNKMLSARQWQTSRRDKRAGKKLRGKHCRRLTRQSNISSTLGKERASR